MVGTSFGVTYEGLKLPFYPYIFHGLLDGFGVTYEGLKLSGGKQR